MQQSGAGGGRGCALLPLLGVLLFQVNGITKSETWEPSLILCFPNIPQPVCHQSLLILLCVYIALSLEIKADAHVRGYVGEKIKLKCTFRSTSSITDKLTIDWTYRAPSSSRTESIFHYQSFQYPTTAGTFRDRISWAGDVYRGDASISISNPTLKDNGTFSCAVKNPPDVHHNIPVTELTVTERGFGIMLSSVALLSVLVFVPSAVVVVLLLVRMGRKSAGLKKRNKSGYKKSSIEVSDDTDQEEADDCMARLCVRCAECLDSDYEETY
ncbi:myelin protein zero-like protein 3 isoform X1 [Panthera tigris]|uniref:myelin protein zero-like protein 3 isoform X2 n=1 Tax=Panthera leo TaxID=9689 RepID=UPI001C69842B|nr:myelin protein zero-like protein 3 isoform X2 [Panthera leo]XP_042815443.1 myelin protein zero-like protein 3 isoform X1 [Panthera tigris]